jgi:acyl-CoA dehydrogenase
LLTDIALFTFGGTLKRQEKLTGRFADILSWMYLGTATLRRYEAEGRKPEDLPVVDWAMQYAFAQIQKGIEEILSNLPIPVLGTVLRGPVLAWWRLNPIGTLPADALGSVVAQRLQTPGVDRDRLTANIYIPAHPDEALGRLEQAFRLSFEAEAILKTIKAASQTGQLPQAKPEQLVEAAIAKGIITEADAQLLREATTARNDAVQVDSFTLEEYQQGSQAIAISPRSPVEV